MNLDPKSCYKALRSRDSRFDGRFFVGVVTTGVYCRPVCPAPTPKSENVQFYSCAAAAEESGFRPCLRCRPETSPGAPPWVGSSTTVSRALKLIEEGLLDEGNVEALAERLGIGDRHLRRLFLEHLGASPIAVAQTRRVQFAKNLIDQTKLPISRIAFSAGFSSIRRFNAAVRRAYRMTPSQLRAKRRPKGPAGGDGADLHLRLAYRPPLDWKWMTNYLALRAIPGVEHVSGEAYKRTIEVNGVGGIIEVRPIENETYLDLRVQIAETPHLARVADRVRRIFDLKADPEEIFSHLGADSLLAAPLRAYPGLRAPGAWDGFELAVRAILGQQVSVKGASTLAGRLARRFGRPIERPGEEDLTHLFPRASVLARSDLTQIGIPLSRSKTIRGLARAYESGEIDFQTSGDPAEFISRMTRLPGIGDWTAQYVAMRALDEPDAFPAGDLGLLKAASRPGRPMTPKRLEARSQRWRPWRAYAAVALWSSLAKAPARKQKKSPSRSKRLKNPGGSRPGA